MASLAICAFLYAGLSGEPEGSGRGAAGMVVYSLVLGLSVLALFYTLALMMVDHKVTRSAARYPYWVVVIAGPLVVMRFLASLAHTAWQMPCQGPCGTWAGGNPAGLGTFLIVILLVVSLLATRYGLPNIVIKVGRWRRAPVRSVDATPTWPARAVFWVSITVAVGSLLISTQRPEFIFPSAVSFVVLVVAAVLLAGFSLLCVAALRRRIQEALPRPARKEGS